MLFQNILKKKLQKHTISQLPSSNCSFLRGRLGISDIDIQLKSLKLKWIQWLINCTNALWKDLMLYRLNLILNSNQDLAFSRQKRIIRSKRLTNLQKQKNEDFFIQLPNAWLYFINKNFSSPTSLEEFMTNPYF